MLYERAKRLKEKGLSAEEISRQLLGEGEREQDVKVVLGSLGFGPQPMPDPGQRPLTVAKRVLESRAVRLALFGLGAAVLAGVLYALLLGAKLVGAVTEGLSAGQ